jgi:hypothetical protein
MSKSFEVDRFLARTDKGKEYTIVIYQDFISVSSRGATIRGAQTLRTSTGLIVVPDISGGFRIPAASGDIAWKV